MRLIRAFGQTLRNAPAEAEIASHQLLLRAGYIRHLRLEFSATCHWRSVFSAKIEAIVREEMKRSGDRKSPCRLCIRVRSGKRPPLVRD